MGDQYDWNCRPSSRASTLYRSNFRPDTPLMQMYMASADPILDVNYPGRVTPDMFNTTRRSRTRSIGNMNSPSLLQAWSMPWMASPNLMTSSPFNPFRPLSAGPNMRHSQSPLLLNNVFRPPSIAGNTDPRSQGRVGDGRGPPPPENCHLEAPQQNSTRTRKFKTAEWETHKRRIKELFMDDDKSLDDTMRIIDEESAFNPTKKQYNNKLRQWGFHKKISGSTSTWMAAKASSRKREGKETRFTVGGQPWTMDRIERSAKRAKLDPEEADQIDANTPPGVAYGTPREEPKDPAPSREDRQMTRTPQVRMWNPYPYSQATPQTCFRLRWDGKSKSEIDAVYERAKEHFRKGNFDEAKEGYLQTLGGYVEFLGPTHETSNAVAYELADLYAQMNCMDDADKVLDWMSEKHTERWGLRHKRIREHMIQVSDLLESWSRIDDAVALTSRMADSYGLSENFPNPTPASLFAAGGPHQYQNHDLVRDRGQIQPIGKRAFALQDGDGDQVQMDYQVRLAITRAKAEDDQAETLLVRLLERCENHPTKLAVQIFEARTGLLELYRNLNLEEKFQRALSDIEKSFNIVFDSEAEKTELVLQRAVEMITWLVKSDLHHQAHPLLLRVQSEAATVCGPSSAILISVLIRIGIVLQERDCWESARPRFEQALAAAISGNASFESPLIKRLEDAIYEKKYKQAVLTPEDIRRQASMKTNFPDSLNGLIRRHGCWLTGSENEGVTSVTLLSTVV